MTQSKIKLGRDSLTPLRAQSAPHEQRKPDQERAGAEVEIGPSTGLRFAGVLNRRSIRYRVRTETEFTGVAHAARGAALAPIAAHAMPRKRDRGERS
jgi:hypothetical protein